MGQCWGRTPSFKRCENSAGVKLFCNKHKNQPLYRWFPALIGLVASIIGIYSFFFPPPIVIQNPYGIPTGRYEAITKELGVTQSALNSFFKILKDQQVPIEDLDSKLREIANNYKKLQEELSSFQDEDPKVKKIVEHAQKALESADFAKAETLIKKARIIDIEAAKKMANATSKRYLSAAKFSAVLGDLYMMQLKYSDAAIEFKNASEYVPPGNDQAKANYLIKWGSAAKDAGHYAKAEEPLRTGLAICESSFGHQDIQTARALSELAILTHFQGKYDQAEPLYRRAISITEKALGSDHPNTLTVKNNYESMLAGKAK